MAEWPYSAVSVDQLCGHLDAGASADLSAARRARLEWAAQVATETAETQGLGGLQIVSRGQITEYHTLPRGHSRLWLSQYPVKLSSLEIAEDSQRVYATNLVANTDYFVTVAGSTGPVTVQRVSGGLAISWLSAPRSVRVRFVAGHRNVVGTPDTSLPTIPAAIAGVVLTLAALLVREIEQHRAGVTSVSDATGSTTRFTQAKLTDDMRAQLSPYRRRCANAPTWEIAA